jgi:quinol monooxygenase YgiN
MQKSMLVLLASVAIAVTQIPQSRAQNVTHSAQSQQIYWTYTGSIKPGRLDDFRQLVSEAVANTANEPGTLEYQYNLAPDNRTFDIVERYVDSNAVVTHVNGFKEKYGKRFGADTTGTRFAVYGPVSAEAKQVLAGFNPIYMSPIDGFVRQP